MKHIEISIVQQTLFLKEGEQVLEKYSVSTAKNGVGEVVNSECTPRGEHIITDMLGGESEDNTVFVGRVPTGELYSLELRSEFPNRDWILTRILRLSGCEPGFNQGGDVDTFSRYIYIHGAPNDVEMGKPGSHGCVRMKNKDIIDLFEKVTTGTKVYISE